MALLRFQLCLELTIADNSTATSSSSVSQRVSTSIQSSLSATVASQSDSKTSSSTYSSNSLPVSSVSAISSSTSNKGPSTRFTTPNSDSHIPISIEDIVRPSRTTSSPGISRNVSSPVVSASPTSGNASMPWTCPGCALQAFNPEIAFFTEDRYNQWSATTVTATVVTEFTTYDDTIVTNTRTMNRTTMIHSGKDIITHTAPSFTYQLMPGTFLTLEAGPTYVIYNNLEGGINTPYTRAVTERKLCEPKTAILTGWEPTRTEDWSYFIESYTTSVPSVADPSGWYPISVPGKAIKYLQSNAILMSDYQGANLATCTVHTPQLPGALPTPENPEPQPDRPGRTSTTAAGQPVFTQLPPPPFATIPTQTYISVTYETTSAYTSVQGCLRAGCGAARPTPGPGYSEQGPKIVTDPGLPNVIQSGNDVVGADKPTNPPTNPQDRPGSNENQGSPGHVTIGDSAYNVGQGQPTSRPGQQPNAPPPVVVGTETLTQGQSTNINGVPVVVPTNGGGSRVIIGGTTIAVNNGPTMAPVLTVGRNAVTANQQGQFVVGSQTLRPGGPAITADGSTLSLGPGGTIAIINGVTQTIANAPIITSPPVITVGGRVVSATVIGGTTQVVLGDNTLAPGSALTISGTTYSLPATGGGVVVIANGATSTLSPGISPVVLDGTTAFIFGPGQTLTPGGVVTVSGTTYSMPANNVIVINGVTSTFGSSPLTAAPELTINGRTYTATTRDGTTEFVLAPGMTLRPGQAITMSGTTYSLDPQGTALIVNGATSSIPVRPASNSASTTASSTRGRDAGDFIWSGIGGGNNNANDGATSRGGAQGSRGGLDKSVENAIIGLAGWLVMLV